MSESATAFAEEIKTLGEKIVGLTLKQAKELSDYLKEVHGIEAASEVYFNKTPKQLTVAEACLLAGLPQAPSAYNPMVAPEKAMSRRNEVIQNGFFTDQKKLKPNFCHCLKFYHYYNTRLLAR